MTTLSVVDGQLHLRLSPLEKLAALQRQDISVSIDDVTSVTRVDNARDPIRGIRAPGTGLPGVIAFGTWRRSGAADFVAVHRNEPGYVIELDGHRFARLIVSSEPVPELDALG